MFNMIIHWGNANQSHYTCTRMGIIGTSLLVQWLRTWLAGTWAQHWSSKMPPAMQLSPWVQQGPCNTTTEAQALELARHNY